MTEYLIIGNGGAGVNTAKKIREINPAGEITIVSKDSHPMYYRPKLIEYLAGRTDLEAITMFKADWYESRRIENVLGRAVESIDAKGRYVTLTDGAELVWDRLVLATGAVSSVPPIKGSDREGVFTVRTVEDCDAIMAACGLASAAGSAATCAGPVREVILIGGGLLGLETGNALIERGLRVRVVEFFDRLLPRQLDTDCAALLASMLWEKGFELHLGAVTESIDGEPGAMKAIFRDGRVVEGGLVVISAGIRSETALAKAAGIAVDRGIIVDTQMETSVKGIYAAGDCAQFNGVVYGIWPACLEQAAVAGAVVAGGSSVYAGTVHTTQLKIAGIDLVSMGNIDADGKLRSEVTAGEGIYRKLVFDGERLVGVILFGDVSERRELAKRMQG